MSGIVNIINVSKKPVSMRIHDSLLHKLGEVHESEPWITRNAHIEQAIAEYCARKLSARRQGTRIEDPPTPRKKRKRG